MIFWVLSIGASVALLVLTTIAKTGNPSMAYAHMVIAGITTVCFALIAIRGTQRLVDASASKSAISASSAWHMSYIWVWGTLSLLITYASGVVHWHEWLHFFAAFAVAGIAALFFANLLHKDANAGKDDETILKVSRYLAYAQLFGMIVVMLGLLIDGKMSRHLIPRHGDWAANNIFFFGALGLAIMSAYALKVSAVKKET
ncbi:MAG: hypothetical protein ACI89J_001896 [Hyphomicrobiaceae bacterium]|jgi:hypothetical protein